MELVSILASLVLISIVLSLALSFLLEADLTTTLYYRLGGKIRSKMAGQVVWVTNADSGFGAALAVEAARQGARIVLSGKGGSSALKMVRTRCLEAGRYTSLKADDVLVLPLDLSKPKSFTEAVRTVLQKFGKVSCLLHCPLRWPEAAWQDTSDDDKTMQENVLGCVAIARLLLPSMIERGGGSFAVVAKAEALLGAPFCSGGSGSHLALVGFFTSLQNEHHRAGIRVSLLSPGPLVEEGEGAEVWGRVAVERAARLCLVAIAHRLPIAWVAVYPTLTMLYFKQYFPSLCHHLLLAVASRARGEPLSKTPPAYGALAAQQK